MGGRNDGIYIYPSSPHPLILHIPYHTGLSYTTFQYSDLQVIGTVSASSSAIVSAVITNTGPVFGAEVVQLYLSFPPVANEPPQLLRGFEKVFVTLLDSAFVSFTIAAQEVSVFDETLDDWKIVPGVYGVRVGSSSRDIRLLGTLTVH